jgi:hypothetical protein
VNLVKRLAEQMQSTSEVGGRIPAAS